MRYSRNYIFALLALLSLLLMSSGAQAETFRKRYKFEYNKATRKASDQRAEANARKRLLQDYLATKFSKEIVDNFSEEIEIALDPPEDFYIEPEPFKVVGTPKFNADETEVTLTVEGNIDLPGMVTALVQNKVLGFGKPEPKVMFLPAGFQSPKAAKTIRALLFDKLTQAGLKSVAFEGVTTTEVTSIKGKITPDSANFRTIQKVLKQYNADYLIYVDAEVDNHPVSGVGGYICNANFTYTVMRPNNNLILGESVVNGRHSGSSDMIAFDKVIDDVAPTIIDQAVGQLYQSIFADSNVIYNTKQLDNTIAITIYEAKSTQVEKIVEALKASGATVSLGTGSEVASRLNVETKLDTLGLYNFFNDQVYSLGQAKFKTPVIGYSENTIDLEITDIAKPPKRAKSTTPPKPRPVQTGTTGGNQVAKNQNKGDLISQLKSRTQPVITLNLKPVSYNR